LPVYEYKCTKGHVYEKTESFSAPARQKCMTCGATSKRQISMPAVIFKGSGFYSTDNRKNGWAPNESSSGDSLTTNGSSSESKGESKAEVSAAE
jgi:putative FmdB family regulatory protein